MHGPPASIRFLEQLAVTLPNDLEFGSVYFQQNTIFPSTSLNKQTIPFFIPVTRQKDTKYRKFDKMEGERATELRNYLKEWETSFANANGRRPGREDIKANPEIGTSFAQGIYKHHHSLEGAF